jgi:putative oxidoreductase
MGATVRAMGNPVERSAPSAPSAPTLSAPTSRSRAVALNVLLWLATGLLTALFLFVGGAKLLSSNVPRQQFAHWGYPPWFMYANGVVETLCAVMLIVPRLAVPAALIIMGDMIGAVATHATHGEFAMLPVPLAVFVIAAAIAGARWKAAHRRP